MTEVHSCSYYCDRPECIKAQRDELRERLAQQEPVASIGSLNEFTAMELVNRGFALTDHLYTAPPQRKPLTDDECDELWEKQVIHITDKFSAREFIRDVEAAHGIKEST